MRNDVTFEQLNIREHPLAREAAKLLINEVFFGRYGQQEGEYAIQEYVDQNEPELVTHYALVGAELGLVAVASVTHSTIPNGMTFVRALGVRQDEQYRGYGTQLLLGVAQQAKQRGNGRIELVAANPRFFMKYGFRGRGGMAADVDDVILKASARLGKQ